MKKARLLSSGTIIDAYDVYNSLYDRHLDFVDVEEDFRVKYVKAAKNNGRPYFRLYLSREDYQRLSDEQKSRYDILSTMRHFQESPWHREWEEKFKDFAEIEKVIINQNTKKRKRADAYVEEHNICVEFQHSYIDYDFEERNAFYKELGIKTVWLYDLTSQIVKEKDGHYVVLENNAKGFFRVAENPDNLKNNLVFIQAKDNLIYQIDCLERKQIEGDKKSTIRFFAPTNIYTEEEFIDRVRNNEIESIKQIEIEDIISMMSISNTSAQPLSQGNSLFDLWDKKYYWMVVENTENHKTIIIYKDSKNTGEMERAGNIIYYQYITWDDKTRKYNLNSETKYSLRIWKAKQPKWKLLRAYVDKEFYKY